MKKKLALFLSVLSVVLMLGACGTDPKTVDYNGVSYDELLQSSVGTANELAGYSVAEIEKAIAGYESKYGDSAAVLINMFEQWIVAIEKTGKVVEISEDNFTVTKSGKTLTTTLVVECENRNLTFETVYNYFDMELTGFTVEPVYNLGEKMQKAGMNTVICMSIVFAVLIFISLVISCFKIFPYLEAKKAAQNKPSEAAAADIVISQIEQRETQHTDDTELVAVIAAAIAAYEGTSTSDFVVRSIRRR